MLSSYRGLFEKRTSLHETDSRTFALNWRFDPLLFNKFRSTKPG
ncbi:hypothetical protein GGP77_000564 [Salinibacter ruber]|uniref:Uncharacterized protein n=1 Tax=Salinibacter ruber TaxID=146919 RepID=A0A9X2UPT2_9BACT|nr:hypothetical protein [Salinibacter ruber]MCS3616892.1 hypothetical protein [Salinibacter ruber]MCS3648249.1 hypothetical protein [Salinibacter ruber]MCS3666359.1 hypothetical protein [Salinibacter ruber]MCS3675977.1 hypothetical protein [Salinibacter ruber]